MLRIVVADDHPVVRQGLKQVLAEGSDMVVEEAVDGNELLAKVHSQEWDAVILDISMPGRDGLDILKQLKHEHPKLPVLVLSMHSEGPLVVQALQLGASGFLTKRSAPEELLGAIRKAIAGRKYISPCLTESLAIELERKPQRAVHEALSSREYQVMCMIATGKGVKEIAEVLFLSAKTISNVRTKILEKMEMRNDVELARYAIEHKLVNHLGDADGNY